MISILFYLFIYFGGNKFKTDSCHDQYRYWFYKEKLFWVLFASAKQGKFCQWFSKLIALEQRPAAAFRVFDELLKKRDALGSP